MIAFQDIDCPSSDRTTLLDPSEVWVLPMPHCPVFHQLSSPRGESPSMCQGVYRWGLSGRQILGVSGFEEVFHSRQKDWVEWAFLFKRDLVDSESRPKPWLAPNSHTKTRGWCFEPSAANKCSPKSNAWSKNRTYWAHSAPPKSPPKGGTPRRTPPDLIQADLGWILKMGRRSIFGPRSKKSTFPFQTEIHGH